MIVRILTPAGVSMDPGKPKPMEEEDVQMAKLRPIVDWIKITEDQKLREATTLRPVSVQPGWYKKVAILSAEGKEILVVAPPHVSQVGSMATENGNLRFFDLQAHMNRFQSGRNLGAIN